MPVLTSVAASRVALRVYEIPQLAVALQAMGAPLEALAEARAAARPRLALLCTARPLFFTWTPDSRSIIAVRLSYKIQHVMQNWLALGHACACCGGSLRMSFDSTYAAESSRSSARCIALIV